MGRRWFGEEGGSFGWWWHCQIVGLGSCSGHSGGLDMKEKVGESRVPWDDRMGIHYAHDIFIILVAISSSIRCALITSPTPGINPLALIPSAVFSAGITHR